MDTETRHQLQHIRDDLFRRTTELQCELVALRALVLSTDLTHVGADRAKDLARQLHGTAPDGQIRLIDSLIDENLRHAPSPQSEG